MASDDPTTNKLIGTQHLLDVAPDGLLVVDRSGVIQMANRRLEDMLGHPPGSLVGQPLDLLVPVEVHHHHLTDLQRYAADPETRPMGDPRSRVHARHSSGTLIPVEVALSPVKPEGGDIGATGVMTVAAIRDIRDRLAAETAQEAARRSLDSIDNGVFLLDPATRRIDYANAGAAFHTGHARADLVGTVFDRFTADAGTLTADIEQLLHGPAPSITRVLSIVRSDASIFPAEVTFNRPPRDSNDGHVVALLSDISERVAIETERDRRERLLTALAEVRRLALAELGIEPVLDLISQTVLDQLDAGEAFVATTTAGGDVWCRSAAGGNGQRTGQPIRHDGLISEVLVRGSAAVLDASRPTDPHHEARRELDLVGPSLLVPLLASDEVLGVLVATRPPDHEPFGGSEVAVATTLAAESSVALVFDRVRRERHYLSVVEDRERIARDLHDLVIQRLFATGMSLEGALGSTPPSSNEANPRLAERVAAAVGDLDETISVIRRSIFHLTQPDQTSAGAVERLIDRHRAIGRNEFELRIEGDLETLPPAVSGQLIPVLNELLSNVERHANATGALVSVRADQNALRIEVADDGDGISSEQQTGFGLRNLLARAELLGGSLVVDPNDLGVEGSDTSSERRTGTMVRWQVPLT